MRPFAQETDDGKVKVYFLAGEKGGGIEVYQGQLGVAVTMSADDWLNLADRLKTTRRPGLPIPSNN